MLLTVCAAHARSSVMLQDSSRCLSSALSQSLHGINLDIIVRLEAHQHVFNIERLLGYVADRGRVFGGAGLLPRSARLYPVRARRPHRCAFARCHRGERRIHRV